MLTQKLPPKKLPLGIENFQELVDPANNYLYVDKTIMIKEFFDGAKVSLITRPRRWGKTLNMSMLRYFFAPEVNGKSTKEIFDKCQISKDTEVMQHQGQYPVIFLTLKNIKANSFDKAKKQFFHSIRTIYLQYSNVFSESKQLSDDDRKDFRIILDATDTSINEVDLQESLMKLSRLLYIHYNNKKVFILIDEYDTPLNHSYHHKYIEELTEFMKVFLGATLKGNDSLEKGLMTGILRLSKNNMLSDLNNLEIYSVFNNHYSEFFGFSEDEVKLLFKEKNLEISEDVKNWYNGYPSGEKLQVHNPVSIIKCIAEKGKLEPYWLLTADDSFIQTMLLNANDNTKSKFEKLLTDKSIEGLVNDNVTYEDLNKNESSLWSILLASGYLKATKWMREGMDYKCTLKIPNKEVLLIYIETFKKYLSKEIGADKYELFLKSLVQGNVEKFTEALGDYLLRTASIFETGDKSEKFYHGFSLGLISSLPEKKYHIRSNRESGLGRYDVCIIPKLAQDGKIGIILEFKHAKSHENTKTAAEGALKQIKTSHYDVELKEYAHIESVLQIGLAFSGKSVVSAYEEFNIKAQIKTPMKLTKYSSPDEKDIYDSEDNPSPTIFPDKSKREWGSDDKHPKKKQKISHNVNLQSLGLKFSDDESPSKSEKNKQYSDLYLTLLREILLYGDNIVNFIQEEIDIFATTSKQLQEQADSYGYTCVDVEAKGNCFYLAIADQLNILLNLGHDAEKIKLLGSCLRKLACEHIQRYFEAYEGFIDNQELKDQARDKVWVGEAVITALCYALNINIILIRHDGSDPIIKKLKQGFCTLILGYQVGLHYQSLHPIEGNQNILSSLLQNKFNEKSTDELKIPVITSTEMALKQTLENLLLAEATKLKVNKELHDELIKLTGALGENKALAIALENSLEIISAGDGNEFKKKVRSFLQEYKNSGKSIFTFSRAQESELIICFVGLGENTPIKSTIQESLKQLAESLKSELGKQKLTCDTDYFMKIKLEKGKLIITANAEVINQINMLLKEAGLFCGQSLTASSSFFKSSPTEPNIHDDVTMVVEADEMPNQISCGIQ